MGDGEGDAGVETVKNCRMTSENNERGVLASNDSPIPIYENGWTKK